MRFSDFEIRTSPSDYSLGSCPYYSGRLRNDDTFVLYLRDKTIFAQYENLVSPALYGKIEKTDTGSKIGIKFKRNILFKLGLIISIPIILAHFYLIFINWMWIFFIFLFLIFLLTAFYNEKKAKQKMIEDIRKLVK